LIALKGFHTHLYNNDWTDLYNFITHLLPNILKPVKELYPEDVGDKLVNDEKNIVDIEKKKENNNNYNDLDFTLLMQYESITVEDETRFVSFDIVKQPQRVVQTYLLENSFVNNHYQNNKKHSRFDNFEPFIKNQEKIVFEENDLLNNNVYKKKNNSSLLAANVDNKNNNNNNKEEVSLLKYNRKFSLASFIVSSISRATSIVIKKL
jgi:hypothetical protein